MDEKEVLKIADRLNKQAYKLAAPCKWFDIDGDCDVKYLTGNTVYYWELLCCGLYERLKMCERGCREKDKLRKNTKNYYKLFYKNGRLLKIENYIENRIAGYYLCFYVDNVRVLQSFDDITKKPTWHYCIVTWFADFGAEKEVWINGKGSQIIFGLYEQKGDVIEYTGAHCLPHAKYAEDRVYGYRHGLFSQGGTVYERIGNGITAQ